VRSRLAEHLGISDAKVSQYLKQHCLVRWLQLDEEAPHLAHFAIAVLKPPLNAE
jgi:predicted transcriptional regulator